MQIATLCFALLLVGCAARPTRPSLQTAALTAGSMTVDTLRCEYLVNPLAVQTTAPRFDWTLQSAARSAKQTAFEIEVTSDADRLKSRASDLWRSGKIASDRTSQVVYGGKPLASRTACTWRVRVYDENDIASGWSAPATFRMGLLAPNDWSARWLDAAAPTPPQRVNVRSAAYRTVDGAEKRDVTALVAALVKDGSLDFTADNTTLGGDPKFGVVKQLDLAYELEGPDARGVIDRKVTSVVLDEDALVTLPRRPVATLRRAFTLPKVVRTATLYVSALGLHDTWINGRRVTDDVLSPDWTDYRKRVIYDAYDVSELVGSGENLIASRVAPGWYAGRIGNGRNQYWGTVPALLAQLEITYADGTTERVATDESWQVGPSAVVSSDFMLGENHDARLEQTGWNDTNFQDPGWTSAVVRDRPAVPLVANTAEPVRPVMTIAAQSVKKVAGGKHVYDFGQNMVGVVRLNFDAPEGTVVTLRHAEILDADGSLYVKNLRGAPSIDTYTFGKPAERYSSTKSDEDDVPPNVWQPTFAFHGFRYVELAGLPTPPPPSAVTGIVYTSDAKTAGTFECSDPRINQLQSNIVWGQRGNFVSVPTDCPQRDERLGWMGDAQVFVGTAVYNADVAAFFARWLQSVRDAQKPDGRFSDVVPDTMDRGFAGAPGWGDAGVIVPWTIYRTYGDQRLLAENFSAMCAWVDWLQGHTTGLIRDKDRGNDYGDWLSQNANTPKDLIATAYFAYSTSLTAQAARLLGKTAEAEKYEKLFADIKTAFNKKYVQADGKLQGDTQAGYAMALHFGLLDAPVKAQAQQHLADDIRRKEGHLSTGFLGVSYLLPVLTDAGRADTAFKLLMQDTFPSWLFSVKHGATTIWERWDGWTPDKGFQDPGMNSFNHYSLGSCGQWLYESVAGINQAPDSAGFKKIVIRPHVGGGLTHARATYKSAAGLIGSAWKVEDGKITLDVEIPVNATATIYVPATRAAGVTEGGRPVNEANGVKASDTTADGYVVYEVGAGRYSFAAPYAPR